MPGAAVLDERLTDRLSSATDEGGGSLRSGVKQHPRFRNDKVLIFLHTQIQGSLECCCPMATHQVPLSLVPWEQDSFLQAKVEDEEASLSQASNPHEALTQLHKLCCQWLKPELHSKEQMLDLLVLEQFLGSLPAEIQAWVGAQCPKSSKEAAMLVEDLTQALNKRGWELGAEPSEESREHGHSEASDTATETLMGSVSPGHIFAGAFEPQSSSEKLVGLLGDIWTKSATQKADFRDTPGHHKDAPMDQSGCESDAFRSRGSPSVWPDVIWEEKTPYEEKFGSLDGPGTESPCVHAGRTSSKCRECGKMFQSIQALGGTPKEPFLEDTLHLQ
ncbi:zinc finger and SCAN domain-containing protein 22-like [Glossophaga mutica]